METSWDLDHGLLDKNTYWSQQRFAHQKLLLCSITSVLGSTRYLLSGPWGFEPRLLVFVDRNLNHNTTRLLARVHPLCGLDPPIWFLMVNQMTWVDQWEPQALDWKAIKTSHFLQWIFQTQHHLTSGLVNPVFVLDLQALVICFVLTINLPWASAQCLRTLIPGFGLSCFDHKEQA